MTYLLDTNTLSEATKTTPDEKVKAWIKEHRTKCAISSITVAEMRYGIERRVESREKNRLETVYRRMLEDHAGNFFEFDCFAAAEWGRYASELEAELGKDWWKMIDLRDTQIAAIARCYGLTVVTRNTKDFPFCKHENPFS